MHAHMYSALIYESSTSIFMHMCTAKPRQPRGTSGSIRTILDQSGTAAIASVTWNPPENHNETAIDFYELTLIGAPDNNTFFYRANTQQTFSSQYVLSEGNYTAAAVRITVVDLCEQRSESSQIMLSKINYTVATTTELTINPQIDELNNMQHTIDILGGILAFTIVVIIALIIIILILSLIIYCKRASSKSVETDIELKKL